MPSNWFRDRWVRKGPAGRRGLCVTAVHLWGDGGLVDYAMGQRGGLGMVPGALFVLSVLVPQRTQYQAAP